MAEAPVVAAELGWEVGGVAMAAREVTTEAAEGMVGMVGQVGMAAMVDPVGLARAAWAVPEGMAATVMVMGRPAALGGRAAAGLSGAVLAGTAATDPVAQTVAVAPMEETVSAMGQTAARVALVGTQTLDAGAPVALVAAEEVCWATMVRMGGTALPVASI